MLWESCDVWERRGSHGTANRGGRERVRSRGGGELPAKTIMRGSVFLVYSNSSSLVLLILLTFFFCLLSFAKCLIM